MSLTPGNWFYVGAHRTSTQDLLSVLDDRLCCKMHFLLLCDNPEK